MRLRVAGGTTNLKGAIRVPGDKSITHRGLLFGAMAAGGSRLRGPMQGNVIEAMENCLAALGVAIESPNSNETIVHGAPWQSPDELLDCQNSGTTMRLLLGALAGSQVSAVLGGSHRLSQRPMARVAEPLRKMGAQIRGANGIDQPPMSVTGTPLHGIEYEMPVASAQVKTAILLAGLHADSPTVVREPIPSRDHSERLLRQLSVTVEVADGGIRLEPIQSGLPSFEVDIPGDLSAAAFLVAAALLIPGSEVTVERVGLNPTRTGLLDVLRDMGAQISISKDEVGDAEPIGDLGAKSSGLRGTTIDGERVVSMIDEIPILAVVATQADGETEVRGAGDLRVKESDRLSTMTIELKKMGAKIEEHPDGITIEGPTPLAGTHVSSHGDHRVAMALAIAGTLASGETTISGAEVVRESYPRFVTTLRSMGAELQ